MPQSSGVPVVAKEKQLAFMNRENRGPIRRALSVHDSDIGTEARIGKTHWVSNNSDILVFEDHSNVGPFLPPALHDRPSSRSLTRSLYLFRIEEYLDSSLLWVPI